MSALNAALRAFFDWALSPFRNLDPLVGLFVVSLPISIGMLFVYKATSAQTDLDAVKRRIHACLFEIRLYNDDLAAILRAQIEILRHNFTYLRLSLVPMLWMIVPLGLVFAQLQFHYGYEGLTPGQPVLVEVQVKEEAGAERPPAMMVVPDGMTVETPAVWVPSRHQLFWRVSAQREGDYDLNITVAGHKETKSVRVAQGVVRRSPLRVTSLLDQFLYPAEPPLPARSPIESISLGYPERDVNVFGWGMPWWLVFFALTIIFAFLLKGPFGVTM